MNENIKYCNHCNNNKNYNDFIKQLKNKIVITTRCIDCRKTRWVEFVPIDQTKTKRERELVKNLTKEQLDNKRRNQRILARERFNLMSQEEKNIYNKKRRISNKPNEVANKIRERVRCLRKTDEYKKKVNGRAKEKLKTNIFFKLRLKFSTRIRTALKGKKNNNSILKYLPYSINELKIHLENKFEPWMNWSNYGVYKTNEWNDDDVSTWKWQIDHIMPHSLFNYESMEDDGFKKCWCLNNLRPYSAKQNLLDGVNKIRHTEVRS